MQIPLQMQVSRLDVLAQKLFFYNKSVATLVGLRQNRSAQDEKLVEAIFSTSIIPGSSNLIVDARPSTNAHGQHCSWGAGSENMDHYRLAKKAYLGIDNIHVMRESLYKLITALKNSDVSANPPQQDLLLRSHWLKHISSILQGGLLITRTIHEDGSHVLVHCSDGWDRTSQLCALPQLCLDPHYRTLRGFMTLVEKDWLAFGHRFQERCVPLLHKKRFTAYPTVDDSAAATFQSTLMSVHSTLTNFARENFDKYASPIFHQFLDSVWQLTQQFPKYFEFNERFLRRLLYHVSSCQYGSFLYNSEYERNTNDVKHRSRCVWDYFLVREDEFKNPEYEMFDDVLMIDPLQVKWWASAFGQTDENMNTDAQQPSPVS
ncbi:myotubularin family phosphatidylinositol-3-phosphatase [Schizosaccharomyces japonicus yFS275]|uniref:Myotubularin family phosphatidylinositol-3-phosphatase n=1 Tax=Schizosaccharomyces japonicus (strain yFS275 / FY16936) TaxID=402676 RepID=B6K3Q7_SCHJY|nr:myotubularin family phosphatidylinositol-3-phosphatase [Schizosaccharomyces japonicus yFS275]EEB08114.2 myotubularin family phosphatidylinositol-3-phosphatase [Schizosaccharomyces japonicus yFS275]